MKKITNSILLFLFVLIGMNFSLQAQSRYYTDDVYGRFANSDSRVVTTIKEIEDSDELQIEAILVGWLHVGTFQVTLKYDNTVVVPINGPGGAVIGAPQFMSEPTIEPFVWFNPDLKNVDKWKEIATGEIHPEASEPWMHILVGGNEYLESSDTLQTGRIRQVFKAHFKKLPGKEITNTTFTYYEKLGFPPARNQFTRGSYLYMTGVVDGINTYEDVDVFSLRIPSTVKTITPEIYGLDVVLNGIANSEGVPTIPSAHQVSGGLDWDTITATGFIYSKNNVTLRIDDYSDFLWIGATKYDFPNATEIAAGTFTRGTYTFDITFTPNPSRDTQIEMTETLENLERGVSYYAYAYMIYKFQTSDEYPAIGERFEFIPGCSTPVISVTNDGEICAGANVMLYVENFDDYEDVTYQWYLGTTPTGENYPYLITTTAGDYKVKATVGTTCVMESEIVTVTVSTDIFDLPRPVIAASNAGALCGDATVLLYVENVEAFDGVDYQWYFNGYPISGATNSYYVANTAGGYQVEVSAGDCSMTSITFTVTLIEDEFDNPLPEIAVTNNGVVCNTGNVMVHISNMEAFNDIIHLLTFQWYHQGIPMEGETYPFLVTNVAGFYHVEVIIGDCSAVTEDVEVTIGGGTFGDVQPIIAYTHNGVLCEDREVILSVENAEDYTGATYQWYHNGAPVTGADQVSYDTYDTGYYHVEVTISGCALLSDEFYVSYKDKCSVPVSGTMFPFVKIQGYDVLGDLFTVTVSIKELPSTSTVFNPYELLHAEPLLSVEAQYYDGSFFVPNTPQYAGSLGVFNNYGVPIDFQSAIGFPHELSDSEILKEGEAPIIDENMTVGLYIFDEVPQGTYILEIKREGYMVRWAKITVGDDPLFVEHREIVPGDVNQDFSINIMDINELSINTNVIFNEADKESYKLLTKYDLDADGRIMIYDVNMMTIYLGFRYYHYKDTKEWLDELGIDY